MKPPVSSSLKLAAIVLVFGIAWILLGDLIAKQNLSFYSNIQHYKGVVFVILTTLLIYFVSHRQAKALKKANKDQEEALRRYNILCMATMDAVWDYNMETK